MNSYCIAVDNGVYLSMPEFYVSGELCLSMFLGIEWIFYSIGDFGDSENIVRFSASGVDVLSDHVYVVVNSNTYNLLKKALKDYIISV